jgi:hypothetical protein
MSSTNESFERLKALIHYVCARSVEHPGVLGRIKLNKVPWYADTIAFALYGQSITGERYIKRQFGPVPAKFIPAQKKLEDEQKIVQSQSTIFNLTKHDFTSISPPDTSMFSKEDMDVINQAYDHVCLQHTAMSVSQETHDHVWELAEIGEEIPLQTVFSAEFAEVTEEDIAWAEQELRLDIAA